MKFWLLISLLLILVGISCSSEESTSLGSHYVHRKNGSTTYIYNTDEYRTPLYFERLIPCNIQDYVFDERFIIAAQITDPKCYEDALRKEVLDTGDATNYWIVDKASYNTIGPLTYEEYLDARNELGIPDSLKLNVDHIK